MINRPTGTVTFLFTDIERSTKLWEEHRDAMQIALGRHDAQMRQAIESNHGYAFKTVGDAFCAAFQTAPDAVDAALAHRALNAERWGKTPNMRSRNKFKLFNPPRPRNRTTRMR
jgi:class 3 adenylate cyclase